MGRKKPAENTYKSNRIEIKFFFACYIFAHIICALTLKYALNCPNFCKSLFGTKKKKNGEEELKCSLLGAWQLSGSASANKNCYTI